MVKLRVIEGGLPADADHAGAMMHRHMFDMVLRAAYGTVLREPRQRRSIPLALTLTRSEIEEMMARYRIRGHVDDSVLVQAMAMGLGEALYVAAPGSPAVDLFVEKAAFSRARSVFHVASRTMPLWSDLTGRGPAQGVEPQVDDVLGFYGNTLLDARARAAEESAGQRQQAR